MNSYNNDLYIQFYNLLLTFMIPTFSFLDNTEPSLSA
jgi:hypothetical protein